MIMHEHRKHVRTESAKSRMKFLFVNGKIANFNLFLKAMMFSQSTLLFNNILQKIVSRADLFR
jgi:hypothetical protein